MKSFIAHLIDSHQGFCCIGVRGKVIFALMFSSTLLSCQSIDVELDSEFPVPQVERLPIDVGIIFSEELADYTYTEEIDGLGQLNIKLGKTPFDLLKSLGAGVFSDYQMVTTVARDDGYDGYLQAQISGFQIATPRQTRTDYYEVWMRFNFVFLDQGGNAISEWVLPSYGKANEADYRTKERALEAAARSACRDAMAVFSLRASSNSNVLQWQGTIKNSNTLGESETSDISETSEKDGA